jgi:hypothetical protein
MGSDRRWFWPLVAAALVLASAAATLAALAVENPLQPWLPEGRVSGDVGHCLGLLNLFAPKGDPLDSSDVPLLVGSALAALGCAVALRFAAQRR